MQGGEIELLKQPFSGLMYVGEMVSQPFCCDKSFVISIPTEIVELTYEMHKAF